MRINCTFTGFLLSSMVSLAWGAPNALTYQGRIVKSDGHPLEYTSVSFHFEITSPDGLCVIYREQVNGINMENSKGVFDVSIGDGTQSYPGNGTFTLLDSFNNSAPMTCDGGVPYTPAFDEGRKLRVKFHDGTGWKTISPDTAIRSVPYAAYAASAAKLGDHIAADFLLKSGLPTCVAGTFLSWNGSALSCAAVAGASGGTVTEVTSANSYLTVTNTTSTPLLTLNIGTTSNTVAAGNDTRFTNSRAPTGAAGGDLSGTYPDPTVAKIQGQDVSAGVPTSGQFLKFSAAQWSPANIATADVTGLNALLSSYLTQTYFNSAIASANCAQHQTMYWSSATSTFLCQNINVGLAGDISGAIGAVSVDKIKGIAVSATAPTSGQFLVYNGTTQYVPVSVGGDATMTSTGALTIASGAVANSELANMAANTLKGNITGGAAAPTDVTITSLQGTSANTFAAGNDSRITGALQTTGGMLTGMLTLATGSTTLSPLRIPAGTLVTTPVSGNIESDGASLFYTNSTPTRQKLAGYTGTPANGQLLIGNGTGFSLANITQGSGVTITNSAGGITIAATGSSGTVTNVSSANADIGVATGTTTPVLTLNSGIAGGAGDANKIAKLDAGGLLTTAMIPNHDTSKLTSGTLPIARGGTNSATALANNRIMASTGGAIAEAAAITASRALISDANGIPTHSAVTTTELGYLSGVTSALQTQINGKASSTGWTNYSTMGVNGSGALTAIPGATSGSHLNWTVTGPAWTTAAFPTTTTVNQLLYSSANNVVGGLATVNNSVLTTNGSGVPTWGTISSDVFAQYALRAGRAGGQTLNGGTAASNNLTLDSTSNATKGYVLLNPISGNVGIGTSAPEAPLNVAYSIQVGMQSGLNATLGVNSLAFQRTGGAGGTYSYIDQKGIGGALVLRTSNAAAQDTNAMTIASSGNVGIGTLNPARNLVVVDESGITRGISSRTYNTNTGGIFEVAGAGGTLAAPTALTAGKALGYYTFAGYDGTDITIQSNPNGIAAISTENWTSTARGTVLTFTTTPNGTANGVERMRIDQNGNVGIGTTGSSLPLHIQKSNASNDTNTNVMGVGLGTDATMGPLNLFFWGRPSATPASRFMSLGVGDYTGARNLVLNMNSNGAQGNVGIGVTNPSYTLHVVGSAGLSSGTAWTAASDRRLKDIKGDYEYGLKEILKLHTVRFNYKKGNPLKLPSDKPMTGFIAQEVQEVIPDAVKTRADGYLELNVDPIHWATVNAIQELYGICKPAANLENENMKLKARVDKLEADNELMRLSLCQKDASYAFCK